MALLSLITLPVGLGRCSLRRPVGPRRQPPIPARRRQAARVQAILSGAPSNTKDTEGITLPLNYAELLGLEDVQLPLQPAVEKAYDELMNTPLEDGYSELARLGKEKLLFAARDRLHSVRGRTALLSPTVQVEPLLLPGAMALLHQVRRYDLVIQLSEEGAAVSARGVRSSSRDTLKELEQDMALATALAQCGLADRALKAGQPALACARLEESLKLLAEGSTLGIRTALLPDNGRNGAGMLPRRGPGALPAAPPPARPLAPQLQADIRAALVEYHPDAVADYLQVPLAGCDYELRAREVAALRKWVATPAAALRKDQRPILTPDYMTAVVPRLTAAELCGLYDWEGLAAGGNSARCPWYFPGLLKRAALAHLVTGFVERRPLLIRISHKLFSTILRTSDDTDAALALAMSDLLLGDAASALAVLEQDERVQLATQQQQQQQRQKRQSRGRSLAEAAAADDAAGSSAAFEAGSLTISSSGGSRRNVGPAAGPEGRHAVMQYIRDHSPQGGLDLRPGLVHFASWWLAAVAYPEFQDTALGSTPRPDLAAYFEDGRVQSYLAQQDGKRPSGGMLGMLAKAQAAFLARFGVPDEPEAAASVSGNGSGSSSELATAGYMPLGLVARSLLQWVGAAVALAAALLAARQWQLRGGSLGWPQLPGMQAAVPAAVAEAAAEIGLPLRSLRVQSPPAAQQPREQPQQEQQAAQQAQQVAVITKREAARLVQQWLNIKSEALGPRHHCERLGQVLAEPLLSVVAGEVQEAVESGWFWAIRPLKSKVDMVDASSFGSDGSGHVLVLATVHESADLWASNGKHADSYNTTYQVEYTVVCCEGAWKIASALVLGK